MKAKTEGGTEAGPQVGGLSQRGLEGELGGASSDSATPAPGVLMSRELGFVGAGLCRQWH